VAWGFAPNSGFPEKNVLMPLIRFTFVESTLEAELLDTPTAKAFLAALPLSSRVSIWGEEVYFSVPVDAPQEKRATAQMKEGDIALWLGGPAVAICFGETPAGYYRLISPGNIFAKAVDPIARLASVKGGGMVKVERV
jgi:uncharacterized protein